MSGPYDGVLGWTWPLPAGPTCPRTARGIVADACSSLALPEDRIDDAKVMVSELASNLVQHARSYQPYELWMYRAGGAGLVVSVFDTSPVMPYLVPQEDQEIRTNGRGIQIVTDLSEGRCGASPSRARLGLAVPGKIAWFALPAEFAPQPVPLDPDKAAHTLRDCLRRRGIAPIYLSQRWGMSVLSLPYGLTVWVRAGEYQWLRADGCGRDTRDLHDLAATVEELIFRYEQLRRAAHSIA